MAFRSRFGVAFRTTLCVAVLPALLILYSAIVIGMVMLGVRREHIDRIYWSFGRVCCRLAGTPRHVRGLENVRPGQAYVIVANHESNWDPVVLVAALSCIPLRFIAKQQIIRIPIFGWALLRSGNVRVVRSHTPGDVSRIRKTMEERPLDVSVLFYAEGTRSRDGALHPFKKGAFATAIAYGLPILPVGHAGTYRIWRPLQFGIHPGPATVEIGRPIPVHQLGYDDREKLRDETFEVVRELRSRARRRLRELGGDPGGID